MTKQCTKCNVVKDINLFGKRKAMNDGLNSHCNQCRNEKKKEWYLRNKEAIKIYNEKYHREYYLDNTERVKIDSKRWKKNNHGKVIANCVKRYTSKLKRTALWANHWKIKQYYIMAKKLTKDTGIKFVVDHIVPLQGKCVSGLHVETNLQIITATENLMKSNKFSPEAH